MPQAIFLEFLYICFRNVESFNNFIVFQFETCLHCAVLNQAEYLYIQLWSFDNTTITTYLLILNISFTHVTTILNLYEVNVNDEAAYFYHMPDNLVKWHLFQKHNTIISFKVIYFFYDSADHL